MLTKRFWISAATGYIGLLAAGNVVKSYIENSSEPPAPTVLKTVALETAPETDPVLEPPPQTPHTRLVGRLITNAGDRQYLALGDTNHTQPEIHEFLAMEDTIRTFAENGYEHIVLEGPPELQIVSDQYANGEISETVFRMMSSYIAGYIHASEEDKPRFKQAQCDIIKWAAKYGMQVHYEDAVGIGECDPQYQELLAERERKKILILCDVFSRIEDIEGVPLTREAVSAMALAMLQEEIKTLSPEEQEELRDAFVWTEKEGGPGGNIYKQLHYRYTVGDPCTARNIQEATGDGKTVILYGAGHLFRMEGDLDAELGRENVYWVNLFSDLDTQQAHYTYAHLTTRIHVFNGVNFQIEESDASVCLKTLTFSQGYGIYTCYGGGPPPESVGPSVYSGWSDNSLTDDFTASLYNYDTDPYSFNRSRTRDHVDMPFISDLSVPALDLPEIDIAVPD